MAQQVGDGRGRGEVVDRDHLEPGSVAFNDAAQHRPADPAHSVDAHSNLHGPLLRLPVDLPAPGSVAFVFCHARSAPSVRPRALDSTRPGRRNPARQAGRPWSARVGGGCNDLMTVPVPSVIECDTEPDGHRALLADGTAVVVRLLRPTDRHVVDMLHRSMPLEDRYLRFFTVSGTGPAAIADVIIADDSVAIGAFLGENLLGVAHYRCPPPGEDPELAVAVAHGDQHRGVATLLIEHIAEAARARGVSRFTAEVLTANRDMLEVLRNIGLPATVRPDAEVRHVVVDLAPAEPPAQSYVDAVLDRATRADVASLRPVLAPRSIAVIGVGRRSGSIGSLVLRQIVGGGFTGPVHVVHPQAARIDGVRCLRSAAELPMGVDLAVLCVPARAVPEVAEQCGRRGVRALLVITAGVTADPGLAAELARTVRRHGMRLVGPNCVGLINTDPVVRLQATFGPRPAEPGIVGVAAQSGGVLLAVQAELDRLGLGVSTAVSTGDGIDVNGDDMLLWWAADGRTEAAVLYVESLRRPRQFARLARRLARRMPVLTVRSGSSEVGRRAAASHTAGTATPRVVRDALFAQAGLQAVDDLAEVPGLLAVLCWLPLPAGRRVAVISNAGGAGVLGADACARYGLVVASPTPGTRAVLRTLLPLTAEVANPIDVTAGVSGEVYGRALEALLDDPGVDAVVAVSVPTGVGDPLDGIRPVLDRRPSKPVVAVRLGQPQTVADLPAPPNGRHHARVPAFNDVGGAVRALSAAARRGEWLQRATAVATTPDGVDAALARALVTEALGRQPDGGWLDPDSAGRLAAAAGLPLVPATVVHTASEAERARLACAGPVAVKADVPGILHKSREAAVLTGLATREQVRVAVRGFRRRFGDRLRGVLVQPMVATGVELLVGVTSDRLCGPLLTLGLGGTTTDLVADRAHCLVPATGPDLDDLLDGLRASPRLFAGPDTDQRRAEVRDVLGRMAWLADQLPEVAEAEVNPLVLSPHGPVGVDLRIRLEPVSPTDPWLRVLPA